MAKMVQFISTQSTRGHGTEDDPFRLCDELWTEDGRLVAYRDPQGGTDGMWFNPASEVRQSPPTFDTEANSQLKPSRMGIMVRVVNPNVSEYGLIGKVVGFDCSANRLELYVDDNAFSHGRRVTVSRDDIEVIT